ncbi:MAG TPA: rhodanese-like domain-containing protein [Verrucomicrobiales bacterium]|jgi:rhodanese-related sulfurtransferase|nr:rhodanese-like domain-containing protein [Verrucomicrobiales bacterium]
MILRMVWQSALLLLLAAAGAWATYRWHPGRPELYITGELVTELNEISVSDALALEKAKGVIWLDARTRAEFNKGHIPGAMLLNTYEWVELAPAVIQFLSEAPEQRTIILYCDSQKCSSSHEVAEKMKEMPLGDWDIRVLHGGWPAWRAAAGK